MSKKYFRVCLRKENKSDLLYLIVFIEKILYGLRRDSRRFAFGFGDDFNP